jgi:anti-sigma-K factor RskA
MDIINYISSGIIEMYVMGICSPEEKAEMELLRGQYPELNRAVLQFEKEFENNALRDAAEPGLKTDNRILQTLQSLRTPVIEMSGKQPGIKKMGWIKTVAAAAVLLFTASSIFNYILYKKTKEQQLALKEKETYSPLPVTDYNILKSPLITPVAMYGVGLHSICRCTIFWNKQTGKAYIMIHHLPQSSSQEDYQLWAMVNDTPVSIGLIKDEIRGRFIEMPNVPAGAIAFIVTLEKAGGVTTPTVDHTYLSGKI